MKLHYLAAIADGVLLSYHAQVHRNTGAETFCNKQIPAGRTAPVSHIQAVVFKLPLCRDCYPDHHHSHRLPYPLGARTGRRAT